MKQRCRREDNTKIDLKYRMWKSRMDSKDSVLGPLAGSRKEMNCRVQKKNLGLPSPVGRLSETTLSLES